MAGCPATGPDGQSHAERMDQAAKQIANQQVSFDELSEVERAAVDLAHAALYQQAAVVMIES